VAYHVNGGQNLAATIRPTATGGWRGGVTGDIEDDDFIDAVCTLAGAIGARLLTGYPGLDGSNDLTEAARMARRSGRGLRAARGEAQRLVRTNQTAIARAAARLYRDRHIGGGAG